MATVGIALADIGGLTDSIATAVAAFYHHGSHGDGWAYRGARRMSLLVALVVWATRPTSLPRGGD